MSSDLIPTALPLPPQDIHPNELKVILAEAAARHAEAEAALAAAQDHFDAAERQREYALSEEQKRREREERARIEKLRSLYPTILDDADRCKRKFYDACLETSLDLASAVEAFVAWSRYRALGERMRQSILLHDSQQSSDEYMVWLRKVAGWNELIRSVTSWRKGGVLGGEDDDLDGLAAVNIRINQDSQDAPRPVNRDATDLSTPFIEDLGIRDPNRASMDMHMPQPLEFHLALSEALAAGASRWARQAADYLSEQSRRDFEAAAAAANSSEVSG